MLAFNPHTWTSHSVYNQFPSVEDARISIDESSQFAITNQLSTVVPELIGQVGTTLTHRHWLIRKGEAVIGSLEQEVLSSKPKSRTVTVCPTSWVSIGGALLATEGVDNPSRKVVEIARKVQENASKILPHLSFHPNKEFSNLSIAIDPRIFFYTDAKHFLEKNKKDTSILSPVQEKELASLGESQIITTYISMESPQSDKDPIQQSCLTVCERSSANNGWHKTVHYR